MRAQENVPIVLVANKADLEAIGQRKVTPDEGRDLATKFRCPFVETSAAHRSHVDEVFQTLVREIRKYEEAEDELGSDKDQRHNSKWKKLWHSFSKKVRRNKKN